MKLFKTFFETDLPENMEKALDRVQFKYCNSEFKNLFNSDKKYQKGVLDIVDGLARKVNREHPDYEFSTEIFCEEVNAGHNPPGYTWHHDDKKGRMQLVETEVHEKTPHTGGRNIWGGGSDARRHGKIGD